MKNTNAQVLFFLQNCRCNSNEQPCLKTSGLYDDVLLISSLFYSLYFNSVLSFSLCFPICVCVVVVVLSQAFIKCSRKAFAYICV